VLVGALLAVVRRGPQGQVEEIVRLSSRSRPFALPQSSGEMRTPTRNDAGTAARTARVTSRRRRARAAKGSPPQPSARWFIRLRNWQRR
jgi:hypothetical protein